MGGVLNKTVDGLLFPQKFLRGGISPAPVPRQWKGGGETGVVGGCDLRADALLSVGLSCPVWSDTWFSCAMPSRPHSLT
jgi:hypothetical protein